MSIVSVDIYLFDIELILKHYDPGKKCQVTVYSKRMGDTPFTENSVHGGVSPIALWSLYIVNTVLVGRYITHSRPFTQLLDVAFVEYMT